MEATPQRMMNKRAHYGEDILAEVIGKKYLDYREKWNKAVRGEIVTNFPMYLQFELSPFCNLECVSCLHGQKEIRDEYVKIDNILDMDMYEKILDEASNYYCPSISFHNNSEPMLDKNLEEKIAIAKAKGFIDIIIVTNATLLTEERASRLIDAGVTKITFSIDAYSEEVYKINRNKSDFNQIKQNIFRFLELKKAKKSQLPITRVSFVVNKNNFHEIEQFKKYWEDKVDLVDFQNFSVLEGHTENLVPEGFEPIQGFNCTSPLQQVVIRANGDVLPCCSLYGPEIVLGNVKNETIYDIWNGKNMLELREGLKKGEFIKESCKKCSRTFYAPCKE